ncbi:MAG TPA: hypothetical protein VI524_06645 [Anaerolineales bacterium]|nr:hypothetical protein [Anaerolineales bacterium]
MKRKTFYHLSLLLPYLALVLSGVLTYFANGFDPFASGDTPGVFLGVLFFFSVTGAIWGPLYTWMVVAMLFWGRGKSADAIRRMYLLSPLLLACSMGLPALLVGMPHAGTFLLWGVLRMNNLEFVVPILFDNYLQEQSLSIGLAWALMAALSIVIGYVFVGMALLIERLMKERGLFKGEMVTGESLPLSKGDVLTPTDP